MSLRDFKVSNRNPAVYEAVRDYLNNNATYYHETEEGLELMLDDDDEGIFGNQARKLADVIDEAGGNTSKIRQANGW